MSIKMKKFTLYLRTDKVKKSGEMPLYIRFARVGNHEPKFPMGESFLPEMWNSEKQCLLDDKMDLLLQNEVLRIKNMLYEAKRDGIELTTDILREIVSQRKESAKSPEKRSFYDLFEECVDKRSKNGKLGQSTLKGYETTLRSLKKYRSEILVCEVNARFVNGFDAYLVKRGRESGRGDVDGSRRNRLKHLRAVIRYAEKRGIKIENPFSTEDVVLPKDRIGVTFLERDELICIYKLLGTTIEGETNEMNVMLLYLFGCFTGLRLGDLLRLRWGDLDLGQTNDDPCMVNFVMQKTCKYHTVALSNSAIDIIISLADEDFDNVQPENLMFKSFSGTYINKTLREVAEMAGIKKHLTFHSSRRTNATLLKDSGVPMETISKILGHSSIKMTDRYIKLTKAQAMKVASEVKMLGDENLRNMKRMK